MKKFTYVAIAAAALGMAACSGASKAGYVITGTVEGAKEGDTVYLQEPQMRTLVKQDSTVIKNGTFTFKGVQDSAVMRYITCKTGDSPLMLDFFLENGTIKINLAKQDDSATGTPNNDAYQEIRTKLDAISLKLNEAFQAMGDSTLTDEQKEAKQKEGAGLEEQYGNVLAEGTKKNITNPVGVFLFKQTYYNYSMEENEELLAQIPAKYQNDETIVKIKGQIEKQKKTAVGAQFTDFEMQTPEGKTVKLSDYVGKGKFVLIDFWASWCGPCRRETPNIVNAYNKYKGKNFEIVGVSLDQNGEQWKKAIKDLKMPWPQMSDLKGWQCEGAQLYAVNSIPHTVLIDGEGTIIARGLHGEELQAKLAEVLK